MKSMPAPRYDLEGPDGWDHLRLGSQSDRQMNEPMTAFPQIEHKEHTT